MKSLKTNKPLFICLGLFLLACVVYANTLWNDYAVDDLSVIQQNSIVHKGIPGIPELLATPRLKGFAEVVNDSYRPLSLISFAIEYQMFGFNPFVGHLLNVLFFGGCVVLLFLLLYKLFPGKTAIAWAAAALFAVHPIHTEVVANIKSRDELMCFFFAFFSLITLLNYSRTGKTWQLIAGAALLFFSYLSKETVICFVAIIPLVFFFFEKADKKRSVFICLTACGVTAIFLIIRSLVLKGHDSSAVPFLDNPLVSYPFFTKRLPAAIMVLGMYLRLLFVPYPLISDYSYNSIPAAGFEDVTVWCSLAAYTLLMVVAIFRYRKKGADPLVFGIVFYLVSLALFSNIFFLVYSEMAERLIFFASAGFCIAVGALLWQLLTAGQQRLLPTKLMAVLIPVCIVFSVLTFMRNSEWKDNYTIFSTDVKRSPNNARLLHSIGYTLFYTTPEQEPDPAIRQRMQREAVGWLQKSVAIYPANAKAQEDLGNFFRGFGQYDSAEIHLKEAVRLNPNVTAPVSDLGFVYFSSGQYRKALALLRRTLSKSNEQSRLYLNMGMCYMQMNEPDSALMMLNEALTLAPADKAIVDYRDAVMREKYRRDSLAGKK